MTDHRITGFLVEENIKKPPEERLKKGPVVVIECVENIPCNPCVKVCPRYAIKMEDINDTPSVEFEECTGCALCVTECPGLAIFVMDCSQEDDICHVTVPYEYLPVPKKGDTVIALNREGKEVGDAKVLRIRESGKTYAVTLEVEKEKIWDVRGLKVKK